MELKILNFYLNTEFVEDYWNKKNEQILAKTESEK